MAMISKQVEVPDARSWAKMVVGTVLLAPIMMAVVALTTSVETVLRPIGVVSCFVMSWAVIVSIFHKWRPKILS